MRSNLAGRALALGLAAVLVMAAVPAREPPTSTDAAGHMVLGFPSAPAVVEEYGSVGCPHCAAWAISVWPGFKARFIDTGRARFVLHEMLTGDPEMAAAGFLLARCAGPGHYFEVVDQVYRRQVELAQQGGPVLFDIAAKGGLTQAQAKACLSDDAALKTLQDRINKDADARKVNSTPIFFVNGKRLEAPPSLEALATAIAPPRGHPPAHRRG